MPDQTFSQLLRQHLAQRDLSVPKAARLWHLDPDTLNKQLRDAVSVPRTKVGWWAQVLERPEAEILAAVNRTRALKARPPLELIKIGIPCHTVEQAQAAVAGLQAANAPVTTGQDGSAVSASEVHGVQPSTQGAA